MRFEVAGKRAFASSGTGRADAGAPAVVFIHGGGLDHTVWVSPARYFARKGFQVVAVDLPGHGRSEGEPLSSIEAMAGWVAEAMTVLGISSAAVVGHSMGSLVAYALACQFPERCRALALLGTSAPMPVTEPLLDASADNDHAAIEMTNTWSHSARGKLGANSNPGMWMLGGGERLLERARPGVLHADFAACNRFDPQAPPGSVQCPSLVLLGEADQMTPAAAGLKVAESLPDARVVRRPGCGHTKLSEKPNEVRDALISLV
jgi:pimeloyl-ACP methyl ester carboxylesterase